MNNLEWPICPLGELFTIGAGKTMSAAARNGQQKIPFLRTSNVLWDEIDLAKVDEMAIPARELGSRSLRRGDLLICEGGEIGRAAIWTGERAPMAFQNHLHRLRPLVANVDPRFYVYFLQCAFTQLGTFEGAANRTTIPNLSRNRLAALEVPHPPLGEQTAIASLLSRVRDALRLNFQSTRTVQEAKSAALWELFTRGVRGEPQKESEIGPIPEGWAVSALGDLCSMQSGGTPPKGIPNLWDGPVPWVSGKDLKANRLEGVPDRISRAAAERYSKIASADSVLVLVRGMGLANGFALSLIATPMAFNQDIKALKPSEAISGSFLMHSLTFAGERMLRNVTNAAHGTMRLTQDDLDRFLLPVPDLNEQQQIVDVLDTIDRKINLRKRKKGVLEEMFSALLNRLMTREIRVADFDSAALSALGAEAPTEAAI